MFFQNINEDLVIAANARNIEKLRKETIPATINRETVLELNRRIFAGIEVAGYIPGTFRPASAPDAFNLSSRNLPSQGNRQICALIKRSLSLPPIDSSHLVPLSLSLRSALSMPV